MNQKKAKALRRRIYGDMAHSDHKPKTLAVRNKDGYLCPVVLCTGLRRRYQEAKP